MIGGIPVQDVVSGIAIGDPVTSGTSGSILFVDGSGNLGQDNANLFWNDTTNLLGVGTSSPATKIHAVTSDASSSSVTDILTLDHTASSGNGANGIGVGISLRMENGSGTVREAARLETTYSSVTNNLETSDLSFYTRIIGTLAIRWEIDTGGHLVPGADGLYDIGSATLGVRSLYGDAWEILHNAGSPQLRATDSDQSLQLRGNRAAATASHDVLVTPNVARTAGWILTVQNLPTNTFLFRVPWSGGAELIQPTTAEGTPKILVVRGGANSTAFTAGAEAIDVHVDIARTVTFATGALTTQRAVVVEAPTYAFSGASTLTTAVTLDLEAAPTQGSNATITNARVLRAGGAVTQSSAASATYRVLEVPAHTLTTSGTTNITSTCYAAGLGIEQITISNTGSTITAAASLYIANAPTISGGGTLTTPLAIYVAAGKSRFGGHVEPTAGLTYQLGDSGVRWSQIWGGTIWTSAGTAAEPGINFANTGDGFYQVAGGTIGAATSGVARGSWSRDGLVVTQGTTATGSPTALTITGGVNATAWTASTEAIDVNFNLARTVTFATGALTTQRAIVFQAPTYAFSGASTLTTAVTLEVTGAPTEGSNATITNAYAIRSGGALTLTSAAGTTYATLNVQAHTLTVTGTTQITAACAAAAVSLAQITVTDASAITIDNAATLYIANQPAQAGSATVTNKYAIFSDAGLNRFDGDGTHVFELPADATDPTGGGGAATGRIPVKIGGATRYLAYY